MNVTYPRPNRSIDSIVHVVFVLSSLQLSGGVLLVVEYANGLARRGHRITLVAPATTVDPAIQVKLDRAVHVVESRRALPLAKSSSLNLLESLRLIWSLARAVPPCDVIVATHTPTVVPARLAALLGRGCCAWLYMDYEEMFRQRPIERWLLRVAPRWMQAIFTISQPLADHVRPQTAAPVTVTGAGLPHEALRQKESLSQSSAKPLSSNQRRQVLYVGDGRPRKGLAEFLTAARIVTQQTSELCFAVVSKLPVELPDDLPIALHLRPSSEALVELYYQSDLLVFASWGEGLGYPPLEAMACATPVVLTDTLGTRDYARHGENCLVVPPREPELLAQAMLDVLGNKPLAEHLAQNGPPTAARYDWTRVVDRFERALREPLKDSQC